MTEEQAVEMAEEETVLEPASMRLNSRRDMMRNIANTARKSREEGLDPADKPDFVEPPPAEEPPELIAKEEPPPVEEPPVPELISFNVDGTEQKVTIAQAQEMLSGKARADRELAEQAKRRRELEEMEALAPAPAPDLLPLAKDAVSAILDSTEDEAAEKLVTILGNLRPEAPAFNTEAIIEQAANRAAEKALKIEEGQSRERAIEQFRSEREDIFDDPILYVGFDQYATAYHKEHPEASPAQVLEAAAESVDNWKKQFEASPPADTEFAEKEARKARATENVSQISHRQPAPPEKTPLTHSEIIAQKAAKRGRTLY